MSHDAKAEPPDSESDSNEITIDDATFEEIDRDEQHRRWTATHARLLPSLTEAMKALNDISGDVAEDHQQRVIRAIGRIADTIARD